MIIETQIKYLAYLLNERLKEFNLFVKVYKKNGHYWSIDLYDNGRYSRNLESQLDSQLAIQTLTFLSKFIASIREED